MEHWPPLWPDITDARVLDAIARVPRAEFVPEEFREQALLDQPLPIGYGQTISQPYVVALMTQLLALKPEDRVLEIGTGSGYQAAVLAELAREVYSVEMIKPLAEAAQERLQRLGYTNVHILHGDGALGWPEHAPYDAIIVTAAPTQIPPPLIAQLAEGGRMVIPVGPEYSEQTLQLVVKRRGHVRIQSIAPVRFVPLVSPIPDISEPDLSKSKEV
ncbi:MAG: protein-L-isoaspartate(D-aspartate) O-methyltransferase [Anaerolineae bacterium]|nr:protein-L-isoaspartate(D-aspartate) O-methyltransferase [Anaerolineae bacterium]MDW8099183.1 protein-L-isoaspartate(D-aspartate) O-methyltransferase [Anaerolineae bacterium]